MAASIASAVLLPEQQELDSTQHPTSPPPNQKRRQSSASEQDAKRQRLNSIDGNAPLERRDSINAKPSPTTAPTRRERGRERRLFGAALGALSQNPATAAQRKRSEIEKRQKAQRALEEQETDQRKLELNVKRKAQRQKEQLRFERESMRTRHANLRHMAYFLQTKTEPRLYYKPWETTADEDDRIQDQIAYAEDTIRREQTEYEARHGNKQEIGQRAGSNAEGQIPEHDAATHSSTGKEHDADATQPQPLANGSTNDSDPSPKDLEMTEDHADRVTSEAVSGELAPVPEQRSESTSQRATADDEASKDILDENGEEMVEAAEDTVIF
ncbi:hypothetical protein K491DRAFT_703557 [Lophiostoma macrostomum CBS 122681]|uniref:Pinin/SDK/MemA protein domain-containing protein n=1 Tax=Lophiostoma macrostomum CBS 122681 TaxID=1314788 RepID=A0A6A6TD46_9PLEO|nr:hypothetical protein K491DRAFT_703557 [Lophiostoma macrostomum CBS 122681]